LDSVIARHAGQIVIGSGGNTSEMCQELKRVLEGMGFDVATRQESDASKRCQTCKYSLKTRFSSLQAMQLAVAVRNSEG
jgi:hypothetical protein